MSLITLSEWRTITGVSVNTYDAFVTNIIPYVQSQIETYCDRNFDLQDNAEWHRYSHVLLTRQYPINNLYFLGTAIKVAEFTSTTDYNYQVNSTGIIITDPSSWVNSTFLFATYPALADLKAAIELALPAITLTIETGYDATNYRLIKTGTGDTIYGATRVDCVTRIDDNRTIEIAEDYCWLFLTTTTLDTDIYIYYNSGYATADVPKALKMICANMILDLINLLFANGSTAGVPATSTVVAEQIGDHSVTYGDLGATVTLASSKISKIIENYEYDLFPWRKKVI